jgi:hypothetical protein
MNDIFNIRRFGWYARKEFRENWKVYALFTVGIVVMQLVFIYFMCEPLRNKSYYNKLNSYTMNTFTSLFNAVAITAWIVGSYAFHLFPSSSKTISSLTLPVSTFERFSFSWLLTIPVSFLVVVTVWRVTWFLVTPTIIDAFPKVMIDYDNIYQNVLNSITVIWIFAFSGIFMVGAMMFKQYSFLKILGLGLAGVVILYIVEEWVLSALLDNQSVLKIPYPGYTFLNVTTESKLHLAFYSTFDSVYKIWWVGCLPVILWVATYLKIKEKEV